MNQYKITLTGTSPLLMHADDIEWADRMDDWKNDPKNKKISRAGDDRTPAWRWVGYAYRSGGFVVIPTENVMRAIMEAGAAFSVPGAKGNKSFKSQTQSGIIAPDLAWTLTTPKGPIKRDDIDALMKIEDFADHHPAVEKLGFSLHVKRAKVGTKKHIRVRPLFREWQIAGVLNVKDKQITHSILRDILNFAGEYKGLCDWRPGSSTPGQFGMFTAEVEAD